MKFDKEELGYAAHYLKCVLYYNPRNLISDWIKAHITKRYHIVNIKNAEYSSGHLDPSKILLFANMVVLDKYLTMNKEILKSKLDTYSKINTAYSKSLVLAIKQMYELHDWVINKRPKLLADIDNSIKITEISPGAKLVEPNVKLVKQLKQEEENFLIRLAKVRIYMEEDL